MGISRQRRKKGSINDQYIIHSQRHILKETIAYLISLVMWVYVATIMVIFISAFIKYDIEQLTNLKTILQVTNEDIRQFSLISLVWFVVGILGLLTWKCYNFKRYGKLNRRKPPMPTTQQEILELGLIEHEIYDQLQNSKVIILETNPIKDLREEKSVFRTRI